MRHIKKDQSAGYGVIATKNMGRTTRDEVRVDGANGDGPRDPGGRDSAAGYNKEPLLKLRAADLGASASAPFMECQGVCNARSARAVSGRLAP